MHIHNEALVEANKPIIANKSEDQHFYSHKETEAVTMSNNAGIKTYEVNEDVHGKSILVHLDGD